MGGKIVNFEMKPDPITEYIAELRMTADVIESISNTAQELGTALAAQAGLDFSKFTLEQEDFEGFLQGGGDNPLGHKSGNPRPFNDRDESDFFAKGRITAYCMYAVFLLFTGIFSHFMIYCMHEER